MGRKRWRYLGALFFSQRKKRKGMLQLPILSIRDQDSMSKACHFDDLRLFPWFQQLMRWDYTTLVLYFLSIIHYCVFSDFFKKDFHIKSRAWFSACLMCPVLAESWSKAYRQGIPVDCSGREHVAEECSIWCPCPPHMQGPCRKWSGQWPIGFRIAHTRLFGCGG